MVDAGVAEPDAGRRAARPRRRARGDRHRVAAGRGGAPAAAGRAARRAARAQPRPARRAAALARPGAVRARRGRRRSSSSPTPARARRSCSTSRASAPAQGRTSRCWARCTSASRTLELLAGGGVRDAADLRRAGRAPGAVGALVATALHGGAIRPEELRALRSRCSTSAAATSTPVARSTPVPAGDAVDLEHEVAPVGGAQQVDAGVVRAERRRGPHAQLGALVLQLDGPGARAAREVRAPAVADALDRARPRGRRPPSRGRRRRRAAPSPAGSRRPARSRARGTRAGRRRGSSMPRHPESPSSRTAA